MEYLGNFEVWQYIVFSGVFFVSCLLQGVIGFGAGAFGIPILYFCGFEIDTAIAAITIASMTQSGIGAWKLSNAISWPSTVRPGLIRILFIFPGVVGLHYLNNYGDSPEESRQLIQQSIGIVLILIVVAKGFIKLESQQDLPVIWEYIAFSISGVMLGFIGMGGPAVALWVMCQPWDSKQSRGFLFAMLFYGMIPLAIMLVWQFGATSMTGLILGILGLPVVFMGTEIGIRVGNKLDRKKLQHYALAALFLIGMSAILKPYLMG
ncbi:MAG: sulfite exporter TauE/SafE family protein [Pirellulales bacterium]|jgi:uncharacterized membrane protein YfcA|nr:hypothetical protein [Rhodopirellula sp.]MCH2369503.1 sulfite exporter TauE/SafE family protein [Pirellulales bacterium]|tara:strand:- start:901 stop:1692 length:792 start_codon:yes stop_codon:yes gene_type:complete